MELFGCCGSGLPGVARRAPRRKLRLGLPRPGGDMPGRNTARRPTRRCGLTPPESTAWDKNREGDPKRGSCSAARVRAYEGEPGATPGASARVRRGGDPTPVLSKRPTADAPPTAVDKLWEYAGPREGGESSTRRGGPRDRRWRLDLMAAAMSDTKLAPELMTGSSTLSRRRRRFAVREAKGSTQVMGSGGATLCSSSDCARHARLQVRNTEHHVTRRSATYHNESDTLAS